MDRDKRIRYLSPMRTSKVQASLRIRAVLLTHCSLIQAVSQEDLQAESQIPGPSEWLGMRS